MQNNHDDDHSDDHGGEQGDDHDDEQGGRGEDSGVESAHSLGGTRGEFHSHHYFDLK